MGSWQTPSALRVQCKQSDGHTDGREDEFTAAAGTLRHGFSRGEACSSIRAILGKPELRDMKVTVDDDFRAEVERLAWVASR